MKKKLVSIIIPYFKKKKYFLKTISSIKSQTYKKFEIIVIYDDIDKSDLNFIQKLSVTKKFKLIINKKNLGAGLSRNIGIKKSKGFYLAFLDSDDLWTRNKLEYQIKFMEKKKISFSHTSYSIIDSSGKNIGLRKASPNLNFKRLLRSCDIGLSTVVVKKKILKGNSFSNIKTKEDFVLWLKLSRKYKLVGIDKNLTKWRKLNNSLSSNVFQKISDGFKVYNHYMKFNYIKSLIYLIILSVNFLKKKKV